MPRDDDARKISTIIHELAARFRATEFDPHLTLFAGKLAPVGDVPAILRHVAATFPPLSLRTAGLAHSDEFTKALFIECERTEAVVGLSGAIREYFDADAVYELNPHVSLLYAKVSAPERQRLLAELTVPGVLHFVSLRAVATGFQTQTNEDVEAWRTLAELPLSKS